MGSVDDSTNFEIPKECLAGVVVNEGPDFRVEVKNVPVPEIGQLEADEALFK
jgi:alcohol dehydrogenase, propanol-preferring